MSQSLPKKKYTAPVFYDGKILPFEEAKLEIYRQAFCEAKKYLEKNSHKEAVEAVGAVFQTFDPYVEPKNVNEKFYFAEFSANFLG